MTAAERNAKIKAVMAEMSAPVSPFTPRVAAYEADDRELYAHESRFADYRVTSRRFAAAHINAKFDRMGVATLRNGKVTLRF
ncbi:hypothetical protein [Thiothrix sp.]|jgi:hypothetical protein|uniref:hypothetical protein n=1 Tax=Thiothrix sp. TaxID=1032 RepID=UPI00257B3557|nr:hypothetical protein [Thiothrix sp.]